MFIRRAAILSFILALLSFLPQTNSEASVVQSTQSKVWSWPATSGYVRHQCNLDPAGDGWSATDFVGVSVSQSNCFLSYGPYTKDLMQQGAYKATFSLAVDNNTADDSVIGYIDVNDAASNKILAHREFHRKEFNSAKTFQDFELSFVNPAGSQLEFRVYYNNYSFLAHKGTSVSQIINYDTGGAKFIANGTPKYHQLGQAKSNISWAATSAQGTGYLTYGPYTTQFTVGNYEALFNLKVDNNSADNLNIATVDIAETNTQTGQIRVLAQRTITRKEFAYPNVGQAFKVPFAYDGQGYLEFRVYVYGHSYIEHIWTVIQPITGFTYLSASPVYIHMFLSGSTTQPSKPSKDIYGPFAPPEGQTSGNPARISYGPFTSDVPPGVSTASFKLQIDDNSKDNKHPVAYLTVQDMGNNGKVLADRVIYRQDFKNPNIPQDFDLVFEVDRPTVDHPTVTVLNFNVVSDRLSGFRHISTAIYPDRLSMTALWNKMAHFEFRKRDIFNNPHFEFNSSSLVTLDGVWYVFNRTYPTNNNDGIHPPVGGMSQPVVRASYDHGATWSDPVVIASPGDSNNNADKNTIEDGGAFFDPQTNTWHYLAQCKYEDGQGKNISDWNLCHYYHSGASPMAHFTPDPKNPVVTSGQLWSQICSDTTKSCLPLVFGSDGKASGTIEEGTPQIIGKKDGYFYVTFHGYDYVHNKAVRGVAKIKDSDNTSHSWNPSAWVVSGGDLPGDAILSSKDCNGWKNAQGNSVWDATTGCIGVGDAQLLRSDGFNYILTEAADLSLLGLSYTEQKKRQHWFYGLFRSPTLSSSGSWENYSLNPFVVNLNADQSDVGLVLQYQTLFRDRGELYLNFGLFIPEPGYYYPNYTYQLVPDNTTQDNRLFVK